MDQEQLSYSLADVEQLLQYLPAEHLEKHEAFLQLCGCHRSPATAPHSVPPPRYQRLTEPADLTMDATRLGEATMEGNSSELIHAMVPPLSFKIPITPIVSVTVEYVDLGEQALMRALEVFTTVATFLAGFAAADLSGFGDSWNGVQSSWLATAYLVMMSFAVGDTMHISMVGILTIAAQARASNQAQGWRAFAHPILTGVARRVHAERAWCRTMIETTCDTCMPCTCRASAHAPHSCARALAHDLCVINAWYLPGRTAEDAHVLFTRCRDEGTAALQVELFKHADSENTVWAANGDIREVFNDLGQGSRLSSHAGGWAWCNAHPPVHWHRHRLSKGYSLPTL